MKNLLLPLILAVLGVAAGAGAGFVLKPAPVPAAGDSGDTDHAAATATGGHDDHGSHDAHGGAGAEGPYEYVKLNNQFVVPVVAGDLVESLVVMSLSVEIGQGLRETVYAREPKLRDALLQAMFDHANMGGFKGAFTDGNTLDMLRAALTETARRVLGNGVNSILIVDIARQDV